jgi:hypothetical protein
MFFLLRCAFWLGLVFANMDWASTDALLPTPEQLTRAATSQCLDNPDACAKLVAGAQKLYTGTIADRPQARPGAKPSSDSLAAGDRLPAWRGPAP